MKQLWGTLVLRDMKHKAAAAVSRQATQKSAAAETDNHHSAATVNQDCGPVLQYWVSTMWV